MADQITWGRGGRGAWEGWEINAKVRLKQVNSSNFKSSINSLIAQVINLIQAIFNVQLLCI